MTSAIDTSFVINQVSCKIFVILDMFVKQACVNMNCRKDNQFNDLSFTLWMIEVDQPFHARLVPKPKVNDPSGFTDPLANSDFVSGCLAGPTGV